jgi:hypothetical protein
MHHQGVIVVDGKGGYVGVMLPLCTFRYSIFSHGTRDFVAWEFVNPKISNTFKRRDFKFESTEASLLGTLVTWCDVK